MHIIYKRINANTCEQQIENFQNKIRKIIELF